MHRIINDRRYVMNVAVSDMAFWREPRNTWEKIGSVIPGVEMVFGGPADNDASKQIEELELIIAQGVSGLVVFANNPDAVRPTINKAVEKGIPVVTAFADIPDSKRLSHIGTDQARLAEQIVNCVMDLPHLFVQKKPRYMVAIGQQTAQDQIQRLNGIRSAIAERMEYVGLVEDQFESDVAESQILNACKQDPGIDIIFGCNSRSAIGAVAALKKLEKRPGEVIVTGWDTEEEVMNQIQAEREGRSWIHATAVLYSSYMVQVCFGMLEAVNFGYLYSDTLNTRELRLPAVPQTVEIPMKDVVTRDNVDEYLGKL